MNKKTLSIRIYFLIFEYIKNKGPKEFNYHIKLEIDNEITPQTWKKKLI
jgi:hypothetical protein